MRALQMLGADVDFLLPDRFKLGYGLSPEIVDVAAQQSPDLIITVDNGIASLEGVARTRKTPVFSLAGRRRPALTKPPFNRSLTSTVPPTGVHGPAPLAARSST